MSKEKSKPSAADNLIESLMDDLKDLQSENSFHEIPNEGNFSALPSLDDDSHRLEKTLTLPNVWGGLGSAKSAEQLANEQTPSAEEFEMPEGFGEIAESEDFMDIPTDEKERYQGPSAGSDSLFPLAEVSVSHAAYSVDEATRPVQSQAPSSTQAPSGEDKTVSIQQDLGNVSALFPSTQSTDADKTLAVEGFANARLGKRNSPEVDVKVSIGNYRGGRNSVNVMTSVDASLAQAENLKLAQQRILELEKEVEHLRRENEELASAGEIISSRTDEFGVRISVLEKEKAEMQDSARSELIMLKGNLQYKENEIGKARLKIEELEARLKSDFKKIRVRERELENRLELLRAEKSALVRSKDEYILDQKRKIDQLTHELDNYRQKCLELNKTIEANQDQVKRTERALRLALSNLEAKEENLVPLKKAE